MSEWLIIDNTGHRRGPFTARQMGMLLHIGSLKDNTQISCDRLGSWMPVSSCDLLKEDLSALLIEEEVSSASDRLSMSEIPPLETMPCQDFSCPFAPCCDVVYIWDRESECWFTFDEYVIVCRENGLLEGLPDRLLAGSSDQIRDLLFEADAAKLGGVRKPSFDEPLSDPEKEAKRQKRRSYRERKKLRRDAGVFLKSDSNPNVYVSSLPPECSESDLESLFKQAGLLKQDPVTGKARIKMYGNGDALITFMHTESVALAISRFNEYEIFPGSKICVQAADFNVESTEPLSREELESRAELNRETRKKKMEILRKDRLLKSSWQHDYAKGLPILVFTPSSVYDLFSFESLLSELCGKFGDELKIKSVGKYFCVKFQNLNEAETCLLSLESVMDESGTFLLGSVPCTVFLHDGRDLSQSVVTHTVPETNNWETFLQDNSSDDEDIQIRTE